MWHLLVVKDWLAWVFSSSWFTSANGIFQDFAHLAILQGARGSGSHSEFAFPELWSLWRYICHAGEQNSEEKRGGEKGGMISMPWPLWLFLLSLLDGKWASGRAKLLSPSIFLFLSLSWFLSGSDKGKLGRQIQSSRTPRSDVGLFRFSGSKSGK